MPFRFLPGRAYRMPVVFGPSLGPRTGVGGRTYANLTCKRTSYSVSFLTNGRQLEELLPEGFALDGDPVVTVAVVLLRELEWLAGRGYNIVTVTFPVAFKGKKDKAVGTFMPVLWENLADPIITGREELGWAKIFAEIPDPSVLEGKVHCSAGWMGFRFMDMSIKALKQLSARELEGFKAQAGKRRNDGVLHYKHMPRTGALSEADVSYVTLSPSSGRGEVQEAWRGEGEVHFHKATWEDLPTMVDIVNTLHSLEVREFREALVTKVVGVSDLSDTRILR